MAYEVRVEVVKETVIAAVRRFVEWGELGKVIRPMFDEVYAFLKDRGTPKRTGENVCLYHRPSRTGVELEVGVQVDLAFEGTGAITCSRTPGGRVAATTHWGEYSELGPAHDALHAWKRDNNIATAGPGWELYGDWHDDPAKRRTDVYLLLG